jgi:multiple sugar transport system substrate-binding protein
MRRPLSTSRWIHLLFLGMLLMAGCRAGDSDQVTVDFWGIGREGEVVRELLPDFHAENPGIRIRVQQIPWTAAHEKLLTAFVGDAMPDIAQLGNTWVPEFELLGGLENLEPWIERSRGIDRDDYFEGIWATNVLNDSTYGIPWYVDTRLLFYRVDMMRQAGFDAPAATWSEWMEQLRRLKAVAGEGNYAILLPTNEWQHPVVFGLQANSELLRDDATRGHFQSPEFRRAFEFYVEIFRQNLAPAVGTTQISNIYQEFERGYFAIYPTGPWNIGEFRRRLPASMQDEWMTAPMPGPDDQPYGVSVAGGASLVMFRTARRKPEAWTFIEYLSRPEVQARFYEITGNLPARMSTWEATRLNEDVHARAFWEQLQRVRPTPQVPEWERIAQRIFQAAEQVIQGGVSVDRALETLDRDVDLILEKRRWMLDRNRS